MRHSLFKVTVYDGLQSASIIFVIMLRTSIAIFSLFLLVLTAGCGIFGKAEKGPTNLPPYVPIAGALDEEYLHSPSGDLAAHYPKGWLHVDIRQIPMSNVEEVYTDPD